MSCLPSSPFLSSAVVESAEALPVAVSGRDHRPAGSAAPIEDNTNCIGEIFIGARRLEQLPGRFDPDAITGRDELLYVTLKLMDEPGTPDLPDIPAELWAEFDELPLFLRRAIG